MSVRVVFMAIYVFGHCICLTFAGAAKDDMATMRDELKAIRQAGMSVNKVQLLSSSFSFSCRRCHFRFAVCIGDGDCNGMRGGGPSIEVGRCGGEENGAAVAVV